MKTDGKANTSIREIVIWDSLAEGSHEH